MSNSLQRLESKTVAIQFKMLIAFIFTKLTQLQRTKTDLSKFESGNVGAEIGEAEFYKELIYHTSSPPVAEEKATEVRKILKFKI